MRISKEELMMGVAILVAKRSTCKRLQVGAVITDSTMTRILAYGYNGNYAGGPNHCDTDQPGNCGCIHAEMNAIIKPGYSDKEIMFVTDSPCVMCAKAIINSGIKKVFFKRSYRDPAGLNLLKKAGIKVVQIK